MEDGLPYQSDASSDDDGVSLDGDGHAGFLEPESNGKKKSAKGNGSRNSSPNPVRQTKSQMLRQKSMERKNEQKKKSQTRGKGSRRNSRDSSSMALSVDNVGKNDEVEQLRQSVKEYEAIIESKDAIISELESQQKPDTDGGGEALAQEKFKSAELVSSLDNATAEIELLQEALNEANQKVSDLEEELAAAKKQSATSDEVKRADNSEAVTAARDEVGRPEEPLSPGSPPPVVDTAGEEEGKSLVAFTTVEYLVFETEPHVVLTVARRGAMNLPVEVQWETKNVNVLGSSYKYQNGWVRLEPGEKSKDFNVKLGDDKHWTVEGLMQCQLLKVNQPHVIGELRNAQIAVLNDDKFPNGLDMTTPDAKATDVVGVTRWMTKVVSAFVMHLYKLVLPRESRWGLLYRTYPAIRFIADQQIMLMALNLVQNQVTDLSAYFALAIASFANLSMAYITSRKFRQLKLGGKATIKIRTDMMNTVIQLTREEQTNFPTGKVTQIMQGQVTTAVTNAWAGMFNLYDTSVKTFCIISYTTYLNLSAIPPSMPRAMKIGFIVIPFIILILSIIILMANVQKMTKNSLDKFNKADDVADNMIEAVTVRQLITTYRKGNDVSNNYREKHAQFNGAAFKDNFHETEVRWLVQAIPIIASLVVLVFGGGSAGDGLIPLGVFTALYRMTISLGGSVDSIFAVLMNLVEGFCAITRLMSLLNANTRRKELLAVQETRKTLQMKHEKEHGNLPPDSITINDVTFNFPGSPKSSIPKVSLTIDPEQIVILTSSNSSGKSTVLRLVAGIMPPTTGFIWKPSRWRVRYADATPRIFDNTLLYNLQFGNQRVQPVEDIWLLAEACGLSPYLLGQDDLKVGPMGERLAFGDRIIISIVRALLSSVDLLVMNNALDLLGPKRGVKIMKVLQHQIKHRGLPKYLKDEYSQSPYNLKKKKTVVMSSILPEIIREADLGLCIEDAPSQDGGAPCICEDDASVGATPTVTTMVDIRDTRNTDVEEGGAGY